MIKLFDFAYYYIYQLNKKGYKKDNHEYARGFLAQMFSTWGAIFTFILEFFTSKVYRMNAVFIVTPIVICIYIIVYKFAGKFYGKDGSRPTIVKEYNKKYSFKKENRYYQVFVIWFLTVLWMAFCVITRIKLDKWFGL